MKEVSEREVEAYKLGIEAGWECNNAVCPFPPHDPCAASWKKGHDDGAREAAEELGDDDEYEGEM